VIPGIDAKPVIDVQVSVAQLEPVEVYRANIESLEFVWRSANPDRMKRYFREQPGQRRTHILVFLAGSWSEQFMLLFRDYMRTHPDDAQAYGDLKNQLAQQFRDNRGAYIDGKTSFVWQTMANAHYWAQEVGWESEVSDA
jgi:GrpB-like predicted nucleotidyltransferase (UPF0157 family)